MSNEYQPDLLKPEKAKLDDSSVDNAQKSLQQEASKALSSPPEKNGFTRLKEGSESIYESPNKTQFKISVDKNVDESETREKQVAKPPAQPNDQNTHNIEEKTKNVHQFDLKSLPVQEVK